MRNASNQTFLLKRKVPSKETLRKKVNRRIKPMKPWYHQRSCYLQAGFERRGTSIMKGTLYSILICFIVMGVLVLAPLKDARALDLKDPNLVGVWLFDEGKGEKAKDESQYNNGGKMINAEWVKGPFGSALKFNGKDAYVEIPHSESVDFAGKEKITIMCWINILGAGVNWGRIVDKSPVNRSYTMTKYGNEDAVLWRPITAGGWIDIKSSPLKREQWYHIAAIYDGKEARFYLDGKLDQKKQGAGKLGEANMSLVIGGQTGALEGAGNPSWFDGMIDEILIYDGVLSEDDIEEAKKGLSSLLGVEQSGKLAITWGKIKSAL
jgi:hypothetical protein